MKYMGGNTMNNFCGECGSKLQEGVRFCAECGNQILTTTNPKVKEDSITTMTVEKDTLENVPLEAYQYNNIDEKSKKYQKKESKDKKKAKTRKDYVDKDKKKKGFRKGFRNVAIILIVIMIIGTFLGSDPTYYFSSSSDEAPLDMMQVMFSSPFYYYDNGINGEKADKIKAYIDDRAYDSLKVAELLYEKHDEITSEMNVIYDVMNQVRLNQDVDEYIYKLMLSYETFYALSETHKLNYETAVLYGYEHSYVNADTLSQKLHDMIVSTGYLYESFQMLSVAAANMVAGEGISDKTLSQNELDMIQTSLENTDILSNLDTMVIYTQVIEENINLVNTAKLEVAKENIDYALSLSSELDENINRLKDVDSELLTDDVIKEVRDAADIAAYDLLIAKAYVDELLSNTSHNSSIELSYIEENSIVPVVYASSYIAIDKKVDLEKTVAKAKPKKKGWFSSMVDTVKKAGGELVMGIASDVHTAIKPFKKIIGNGVEVINGAAGAVITYGVYKYEGLSATDTKDAIDDVIDSSAKRIEEGTSGSTVFKSSLEYVNDTTEAAKRGMSLVGTVMGAAAVDGYEKLTGDKVSEENKEWIKDMGEKAGGFLGGVASGAFSGIASGTSKMLNNEATDEDIASGLFDIGTSLIGSSSNIGSLSGTTSGAKGVFKNLTSKVNIIAKNSSKTAVKEGVKESFGQVSKRWIKSVASSADKFKKEFISSAKNNFKEVTKNSIRAGKIGPTDIIDTLVGSYFDGLISNGYNDMISSVNTMNIDTVELKNEGKLASIADGLASTQHDTENQSSDDSSINTDDQAVDTSEDTINDNTNDIADNTEDSELIDDEVVDNELIDNEVTDVETISSDDNTIDDSIENNVDTNTATEDQIDVEENANEDNETTVDNSTSTKNSSAPGISYDDFLKKYVYEASIHEGVSVDDIYAGGSYGTFKKDLESIFEEFKAKMPEFAYAGETIEENEVFFLIMAKEISKEKQTNFRSIIESRFGRLPDIAFKDVEKYLETLTPNK